MVRNYRVTRYEGQWAAQHRKSSEIVGLHEKRSQARQQVNSLNGKTDVPQVGGELKQD